MLPEPEKETKHLFEDQNQAYLEYMKLTSANHSGKCHWDFLLKEMAWMADDFEKESKKKNSEAKKLSKTCKKHQAEKQVAKERQAREVKVELKRKSKFMGQIVQAYWKSCEKIVRHNYNVDYEKKRQQLRTKKLENFV